LGPAFSAKNDSAPQRPVLHGPLNDEDFRAIALPLSLADRRIERDVGAPCVPLSGLTDHRPPDGDFGRQKLNRPIPAAPLRDVVSEDVTLHPWELGCQAIRLSPYHAGLAGPCPTRLRAPPAFTACCCPLWLSPPGKPVTQRHFPEPLLSVKGIDQSVRRRTDCCHEVPSGRRCLRDD